ncbi:MAG: Asp-tRNA(Asn)/Glu-tRNA(Gln) amidotransferase subunit GatB [Parcubacteria group bacterium]|nr:Asp-tRNA(Asn)/Glu-tRNA(Gln) amidotransferase subunit GatB [Parcubacteria group bacterium]
MPYETIIGLEIHVQLKTKSKMFCGCPNEAEPKEPNQNVCPVCMGHPGVLPTINKQAVEWTIMSGQALHCDIPTESKFDRKNYFYPDLPKGYQISQYDKPLCGEGYLEIKDDGETKKIELERIHLEEDAGKLLHPDGANYSLVDYNRASTPLMEIVTKPDIRAPQEARVFLQKLRKILLYIGVSNADMEKGQLRCDANISLRPEGAKELLPKTEIKNLNSFKAVEQALLYEVGRQTEVLDAGKELHQATRGWNDDLSETVEQRTKEGEADYRYFPDPDLPPLTFTKEQLDKIKQGLPELPEERRERLEKQFGLKSEEAEMLVDDRAVGEFFENVISEAQEWINSFEGKDEVLSEEAQKVIKQTFNWITSPLFKLLNKEGISLADCKITAENFAELMAMIHEGKVNSSAAEKVLEVMFAKGSDPSQVVEELDLAQLGDSDELSGIIDKVIADNPGPVEDYKAGKENALQFMVGQVMAATKGKADPQVAGEALKKKIS